MDIKPTQDLTTQNLLEDVTSNMVMLVTSSLGMTAGVVGILAATVALPVAKHVIQQWREKAAAPAEDGEPSSALYAKAQEAAGAGDMAGAAKLIEQGAAAGDLESLVSLAYSIRSTDPARSRQLLERAAKKGSSKALVRLMDLTHDYDPDYAFGIARDLYEKKDPLGALYYARYLLDLGDPQNAPEVLDALLICAKNKGVRTTRTADLTNLMAISDKIESGKISPLAMLNVKLSARKGDPTSVRLYASELYAKHPEKATAMLVKAGNEGSPEAYVELARLIGNTKATEAVEHLVKALELKSPRAVGELALMLGMTEAYAQALENFYRVLWKYSSNGKASAVEVVDRLLRDVDSPDGWLCRDLDASNTIRNQQVRDQLQHYRDRCVWTQKEPQWGEEIADRIHLIYFRLWTQHICKGNNVAAYDLLIAAGLPRREATKVSKHLLEQWGRGMTPDGIPTLEFLVGALKDAYGRLPESLRAVEAGSTHPRGRACQLESCILTLQEYLDNRRRAEG